MVACKRVRMDQVQDDYPLLDIYDEVAVRVKVNRGAFEPTTVVGESRVNKAATRIENYGAGAVSIIVAYSGDGDSYQVYENIKMEISLIRGN